MRNTFLGVQEGPILRLGPRSDPNALRVPETQHQGEAVLLRLSESENEWSMSSPGNGNFGEGSFSNIRGSSLLSYPASW